MRIIALSLFVPLQIALLPLSIVGLALVAYKQMVVSRRLGVSQTGIEVIGGRWTMHIFGMREDGATVKLANTLPNYSPAGMWLHSLSALDLSSCFGREPWLPALGRARKGRHT